MRRLIPQNFRIKSLVVVFAFFIWFFVKTENNYTYSFKIPVVLSNIPSNKLIVNEIPSRVKISVWGKGREIISIILGRKFVYDIDLSDIKESKIVLLSKNDIRSQRASNVEILNILDPDSIHIKLENVEQRTFPILSNAEIRTIPGYTVISQYLRPDTIQISGTTSSLDSISAFETEAIVFKEVRTDIKKKLKLNKTGFRNIWTQHQDVYIIADVQKLMEKPFTDLPVSIVNKPSDIDVTIIPSSLNLTLVGGVDVLLPITEDSISAYLDYEKIVSRSGEYTLAYIDKPDGVRIKDVKPERFRAILKKKR